MIFMSVVDIVWQHVARQKDHWMSLTTALLFKRLQSNICSFRCPSLTQPCQSGGILRTIRFLEWLVTSLLEAYACEPPAAVRVLGLEATGRCAGPPGRERGGERQERQREEGFPALRGQPLRFLRSIHPRVNFLCQGEAKTHSSRGWEGGKDRTEKKKE